MLTTLRRDADLSELTLLGGFKNNRSVFDWCAQCRHAVCCSPHSRCVYATNVTNQVQLLHSPLHPREGYTLEIDETIYSPTDSCPSEDTFYEIELETVRLPFNAFQSRKAGFCTSHSNDRTVLLKLAR
jgi:hypothetical protein